MAFVGRYWKSNNGGEMTMWVTYRRGLQLGLTHGQLVACRQIMVYAPNGIKWSAYEVPDGLKTK